MDRLFDYLVPEGWERSGRPVTVGTRVRVGLGPRRVAGWVVEDAVAPPEGISLRPLLTWSGIGPAPELIELARWAAWRWAGRPAHFLATASPGKVVRELPHSGSLDSGRERRRIAVQIRPEWSGLVREALSTGRAVVRLPPAVDTLPLIEEVLERRMAAGRSVLVLAPSLERSEALGRRLAGAGWPVAVLPGGWADAAAGGRVVVGSRAAAWAPAPGLAAVVVTDAHDEVWQSEAAPTWTGWVVAAERARRAKAPCLLTSPCPTQELLRWGGLVACSRNEERRGWAVLDVVDRRGEDPRAGLFSDRLVALLRQPESRVVCVLNRVGRARLLACAACGEPARCEVCGGAMSQPASASPASASPASASPAVPPPVGPCAPAPLACRRCGHRRPLLCASCGSTRLKVLKAGVTRVREELEALSGSPVAEITGTSVDAAAGDARLLVGTEAVLHRVPRAQAVAFLDFDQELLGPGFRAGEAALALLARAARLVGGRGGTGRVLVQTRIPGHEAIAAALHADPTRLARAEVEARALLRLPPLTALALATGPGAGEWAGALRELAGSGGSIDVLGPSDGSWLVRAPDHRVLCDALARVPRPRQRVRVQVDPRRA